MLNFLKFIGWIIIWPFLAIVIAIRSYSCYLAGKRYIKDKTVATIEERYEKVNKLVKNFLYWKRIKIDETSDVKISNKPMLFVANHKSNIDPLIILKNLSSKNVPYITFIAKKELEETFIGKIAALIDVIFIDRQDIRKLPNIISKTSELLRNKRSVCVFLEGTRIYDEDKFGEFHSPILQVAYETHSSIQPTLLINTIGLLDKKYKNKKHNDIKIHYLNSIPSIKFINIDRNIFVQNLKNNMEKEFVSLKK